MSEKIAFNCPSCHSLQTFTPLDFTGCTHDKNKNPCFILYKIDRIRFEDVIYEYLYRCENPKCNSLIIRICSNSQDNVIKVIPQGFQYQDFSSFSHVNKISPTFFSLFNQSYKAEQLGCKDIAGAGYRKAAEFLIKDYIISTGKGSKNDVEGLFISNCINRFIDDDRIKKLSNGTFRFGNNETHYYNEWKESYLKELKDIIIMLCHYIENDLYSFELLNSISGKSPGKKKKKNSF